MENMIQTVLIFALPVLATVILGIGLGFFFVRRRPGPDAAEEVQP